MVYSAPLVEHFIVNDTEDHVQTKDYMLLLVGMVSYSYLVLVSGINIYMLLLVGMVSYSYLVLVSGINMNLG